ncbi:hypothetical protein [Sphingomonas sp. Leaf10]|uniref:hypothetical protein n=1 Tax=Sphingomonas sp. Leaf10 TaxID=1735676 RepID=UPI0012E19387|nr:hypothetical protein [Sphingomonas sp. Leaf10]
MSTIIAKHGQMLTMQPGDQIKFPAALNTTEGAWRADKRRYAYKWGSRVCFLAGIERLYLVEGTTYSATAPVVVQPPVPEPSPATKVRTATFTTDAGGLEAFLLTDFYALGVGSRGSLGTAGRLPAGIPTDADRGFLRAGIFCHATVPLMGDAVLYGRSVEGFVIAHRAAEKQVQSASALLTGYYQIPGTVSAEPDAVRFIGTTSDEIGVDQRISVDGKLILIDVELTNRTGADLVDLRYMRLIDFDQPGAFETVNEVIERGWARATMAGNRVLMVGSDDPRATIGLAVAVPPTLDPYAIKALSVGTKRKGDDSIHVCFDIGTLAIGASTRFRIVIDGSAIAS